MSRVLVLLLVSVVLAGCSLFTGEEPAPDEVMLPLRAKPTLTVAEGPWSWQYAAIADQPAKAKIIAVAEDGGRLLISRTSADGMTAGESTDGGLSWTFGPTRPTEIWSPNMVHVFRPVTRELSHDGGSSWSALPVEPVPPEGFSSAVSDAGAVVRFSWGGTSLLLLPAGGDWKTVALPATVEARSVFIGSGGQMLVNSRWYSADGGLQWKDLAPDAGTERLVGRIASDGTITVLDQKYAGLGAKAVWLSRSSDEGTTWSQSSTFTAEWPARDYFLSSDGQRAGFGTWYEGRYSVTGTWDGGTTWRVQPTDDAEISLFPWGSGKGLIGDSSPYGGVRWLGRTEDALASIVPVRQPGSQIDRLAVSADGAQVTGVLESPFGTEAWATSDGITWKPSEVPPSLPTVAGIGGFIARSSDGLHGIGVTGLGSHQNEYDTGWRALGIRVSHQASLKQVAKVVYPTQGGDAEMVDFSGAISADGLVISLRVQRDYRPGWGNFVSKDGGETWWRNGDVEPWAWSANGDHGIGLQTDTAGMKALVTSADAGASWSAITGNAPTAWNGAVFFSKGLIVAGDSRGVALGTPGSP